MTMASNAETTPTEAQHDSAAAAAAQPMEPASHAPGPSASTSGGLPTWAWILVGGILVALLAAVLVWRFRPPEFHGVLIQSPDEAADFTLMTSRGEPMSLSDFRGKMVMLYFGYTFCPDVCPTTLNDLSNMMETLGPKKAKDVQVIMVTVDPERDTVEQLSTYLAYFNPDFLGMTGSVEDIQDIASHYGIFFERQEGDTQAGYLVDHTAVVTLVDDTGHVRMIFPYGTTGEDMAADLSYMMR
jgi:protein SCO1/2